MWFKLIWLSVLCLLFLCVSLVLFGVVLDRSASSSTADQSQQLSALRDKCEAWAHNRGVTAKQLIQVWGLHKTPQGSSSSAHHQTA